MTFDDWISLSKQVSLVIFFVTFVGIVFWAFRPANRNRYEKIGRQLQDEDNDPNA
ncbi:MAG: cbb3-type cytochrome c oxidase subunit 3 [Magnetococcales bacterium]|nr:cbb3-type cytochrome c oxidase subunit 3 [Magnetococcales bacterium]NGZ26682.1 cbb3-type cytochrome c oxidase subunit 3 [Magnetococcales bacterium]